MERISIIGAGIGGLATAYSLLKANLGYQIDVYEQAGQLNEAGAGLQLSANATHILNQWGLLEKVEAIAFRPSGIRLGHYKTGKTIGKFHLNKSTHANSPPYLHILRQDLHRTLLNAVQTLAPHCIHTSHCLKSISSSQVNQTILNFTNQKSVTTNWLIGADGIHSAVKAIIQQPPQSGRTPSTVTSPDNVFTGNVAWRCLIPKAAFSDRLPEGHAHLVMGPKSHLVYYYVHGGELLNCIAIKERGDWTEESWRSKGTLDELLQDFNGWHSSYLDMLSKSDPDNCYKWALYDRKPLRSWSQNQCLLMGDAAHPMLPFLAQGAAMAIEDAQAIGHSFANFNADQRLATIENLRVIRTAKVQEEARRSMQIYHMQNPVMRFVRDATLTGLSTIHPNFMQQKLKWLYDYKLEN